MTAHDTEPWDGELTPEQIDTALAAIADLMNAAAGCREKQLEILQRAAGAGLEELPPEWAAAYMLADRQVADIRARLRSWQRILPFSVPPRPGLQ